MLEIGNDSLKELYGIDLKTMDGSSVSSIFHFTHFQCKNHTFNLTKLSDIVKSVRIIVEK